MPQIKESIHDIEFDAVGIIGEVKLRLDDIVDMVDWSTMEEYKDPDEVPHVPVRLQIHVHNNEIIDWHVHWGDSQFDQDHSGHWGASSVSHVDSDCEIENVASLLVEEALDSYFESF